MSEPKQGEDVSTQGVVVCGMWSPSGLMRVSRRKAAFSEHQSSKGVRSLSTQEERPSVGSQNPKCVGGGNLTSGCHSLNRLRSKEGVHSELGLSEPMGDEEAFHRGGELV